MLFCFLGTSILFECACLGVRASGFMFFFLNNKLGCLTFSPFRLLASSTNMVDHSVSLFQVAAFN